MSLYSEAFYADAINRMLSDRSYIGYLLKVEAALAKAQGELSIIPKDAAKVIEASCKPEFIDANRLKEKVVLGGNVAIPLVQQLIKVIKNVNFEASKYVHFGATSQDIIDTATVLSIKDYLTWLAQKLDELESELLILTKNHKETLLIGRTLLQQAKPITFGLKTANWLLAITNAKNNLSEVKKQILRIQLGGAVGGGNAAITSAVRKKFAEVLGLEDSFPWQSERSGLNHFAGYLGVLSGTLGKIAKDVSLMMQTEIAEVFEGAAEGKGGSSTMPHKRNPVTCAVLLSNSARTPGLVATMLSAMVQEHERSAGYWHAEWDTLTELMGLTAGSLEKSVELIKNLEVRSDRMLYNIEMTNGLIYAEKVSLHLSKSIGRMQAHDAVKKACKTAITENRHLKDVIQDTFPNSSDLDSLFLPERATGNSVEWVTDILKKYDSKN